LVRIHHLVQDHTTLEVLLGELRAYLSGRADEIPQPLPFREFVAQARFGVSREEHERYFADLLGDVTETTAPYGLVDVHSERTDVSRGRLPVDHELAGRVREIARSLGVSPATVFHLAWARVLAAVSGRDDVVFGTVLFGRMNAGAGADRVPGLFLNTLPVRMRLAGLGVGDALSAMRTQLAELLVHEHAPLALAQTASGVPGGSPLFSSLFNYRYAAAGAGRSASAIEGARVLFTREGTNYPLSTSVDDDGTGFSITVEARNLADPDQVCALLHTALAGLVTALTRSPDAPVVTAVDVLDPDERRRIVDEGNGTTVPVPDATVPELFAAHAARTPEALAVVCDTADADGISHGTDATAVTYAGLTARVNRLARLLIGRGAGPESVVAVRLEPSVDQVVALLAVLTSGAAYLPVGTDDADDAAEWSTGIPADVRPVCVLTSTACVASAASVTSAAGTAGAADRTGPSDTPTIELDDPAVRAELARLDGAPLGAADRAGILLSDHAACMVSLSPRTGRPGWGIVTHRGIVNRLAWLDRACALSAADRVAHLSPSGTEASVWEILWPLTRGAALATVPPGTPQEPAKQAESIRRTRVTVAHFAPSALDAFLRTPAAASCTDLRSVFCDGESLPSGLSERFLGALAAPLHLYRQTETGEDTVTAVAVRHSVDDSAADPRGRGPADGTLDGDAFVGRPVANSQLYILGTTLHPVPVGAEGDLYLAAPGLPRGWAGQPAATAATFVACPFGPPGTRMYRTGSRARWVGHGRLEHLGRTNAPATAGPVETRPGDESADGTGRLPATPREELLCAEFARALGLAHVGMDDNYFLLGGQSLMATRLVGRLRAVLGVELSVRALFENPTPAGLVACLDQAAPVRTALSARKRPERVPLSFAQQRLWFMGQLEGTSATYSNTTALRLSGVLDRTALGAALRDVIGRHEVLRTVLPAHDGEPYQRIVPLDEVTFDLPVVDVPPGDLPQELARVTQYPFDLANEIPVRAWLFAEAPDEHVLVLAVHHIATDGWSAGPLARDLSVAYAARRQRRAPDWEPLPVQYADYALWQRELLGDAHDPGSLLARQTAYWRRTLAGAPEELPLPADRPRPALPTHRGGEVPVAIGAELHRRVVELARAEGTTVFMVLQAALAALLSKLGSGDDIPIGTAVAGRLDDALEDLIGFFVNMLVLRTDVSGDPSFEELLRRVRGADLAAYAHQDVPFDHVVEQLTPERSMARQPLFQVALVVQNAPRGELRLPGLRVSAEPVAAGAARSDMMITLAERLDERSVPGGMTGVLQFSTDVLDPATAQRLSDRLVRLLESLVADPGRPLSRVELLTPQERRTVLGWGTGPEQATGRLPLPELFAAQVARAPEAVALAYAETELSYAELDERSSRLARLLIARGAGPESPVAVLMGHGVELVVAFLAVVKAGAVYLPVDPAQPAERIAYMLDDAQPVCAVTAAGASSVPPPAGLPVVVLGALDTETELAALAGTCPTDDERVTALLPDHPAYLIYTSGSTGRPKGVLVSHVGIASLVATQAERLAVTPASRVLQFASVGFDAAVWELAMALCTGARLVVAPTAELLPGPGLTRVVSRHGVTHATLPPAVLAAVRPRDLEPVTTLVSAGEALSRDLMHQWSAGRRFIDAYGPTETTVCATMSGPLAPGDASTIGTAVVNTRVFVLDDALHPV
uniref:AMP-binding protein n=1 Tax=Streptomyces shenzhenensis TaxID=943815 RepID=UPI0015EFFBE4